MVLLYGAIGTGVPHDEHRGGEESNEDSALLGNEAVAKPREGHASIISSVSNLSNTIIGSGMSAFLVGREDGK
ncbi:hypothetical protein JVT61DRAFT_246 [Boletus reticuloceps]|uniref:Uncharacterized protein n=1 Tax=Boletus reticuloceps TaxID=495285 RepID=A0A8I2Z2V7_9AGAM|nr:hypothetical protein JVT61DRAFT_246 [Boletus reticuloceps]